MSVKQVFAPILGRNISFGRKHPAHKFSTQFHTYKMASLPIPPVSVDYTQKASLALSQVYLNDQLTLCAEIVDVYESVNTIDFKYYFENQDNIKVAKGKIQIGLLIGKDQLK